MPRLRFWPLLFTALVAAFLWLPSLALFGAPLDRAVLTRPTWFAETLPRTLLEAVEAFDADASMETTFGPELKRAFVELKSSEWWDYHNEVSRWEIDRYLTFF